MLFTKIYEFYQYLIQEKAISIEDITENQILIIENKNKGIKIALYDYVNQQIIAFAYAQKYSDIAILAKRAAEVGYGPFITSCILQALYPLPLQPDNTVRPKAANIFKYYENNPNVQIIPIAKDNPNYAKQYRNEDTEEFRDIDNDLYNIVNNTYLYKPEQQFKDLINKSNIIIKENNINIQNVINLGMQYFYNKYEATKENIQYNRNFEYYLNNINEKTNSNNSNNLKKLYDNMKILNNWNENFLDDYSNKDEFNKNIKSVIQNLVDLKNIFNIQTPKPLVIYRSIKNKYVDTILKSKNPNIPQINVQTGWTTTEELYLDENKTEFVITNPSKCLALSYYDIKEFYNILKENGMYNFKQHFTPIDRECYIFPETKFEIVNIEGDLIKIRAL